MNTIELYPSEGKLLLSIGLGLFVIFGGLFCVAFFAQAGVGSVGWFICALGAAFIIDGTVRMKWPRPVFAADHDGFSVKGGRKRPWADFRGVSLREAKSKGTVTHLVVRVKYDGPIWNRGRSINLFHQSSDARSMAIRIDAFADKVRDAQVAMEDTFGIGPAPVVAARRGLVPHTDPVDVEYNWFTRPFFGKDGWL